MLRVKSHLDNIIRKEVDVDKTQYEHRFDQSERTTDFPDEFFEGFKASLKQSDIITYPFVQKFKERLACLNGVPTDNIFLTPGSDVAIRTMFDVAVTPGSEVVSTSPSFPMYEVYSNLYNANFVGVEYDKNLKWSVDDMISRLNCTTKLVIVANPNNPIGDVKSITELLPLVKATYVMGIPLLIDEAYIEFNPKPLHGLTRIYDNVVICRTMSKAVGAAGLRIGYIIANPRMMEYIKKWRLMHEITGPAIRFGMYILDNPNIVHDYVLKTIAEREMMNYSLLFAGYDVINTNTNWIHFSDATNNSRAIEIFDKYPKLAYRTNVMIPHDFRQHWIRLTIGPGMGKLPFIQQLLSVGD